MFFASNIQEFEFYCSLPGFNLIIFSYKLRLSLRQLLQVLNAFPVPPPSPYFRCCQRAGGETSINTNTAAIYAPP